MPSKSPSPAWRSAQGIEYAPPFHGKDAFHRVPICLKNGTVERVPAGAGISLCHDLPTCPGCRKFSLSPSEGERAKGEGSVCSSQFIFPIGERAKGEGTVCSSQFIFPIRAEISAWASPVQNILGRAEYRHAARIYGQARPLPGFGNHFRRAQIRLTPSATRAISQQKTKQQKKVSNV